MQRVAAAFAEFLARGQALLMVGRRGQYQQWILLADAAAVQNLVILHCPAIKALLLLARDGTRNMRPFNIENHTPALPMRHVDAARAYLVGAMLFDPSRQHEAAALLRTISGHHELMSLLGPPAACAGLMQAAGAASSSAAGLIDWLWAALQVFRQGWGDDASCQPKRLATMTAAEALQDYVQQRVRFANLLVAASDLLCKAPAQQQQA
jgi:hypothetical protein